MKTVFDFDNYREFLIFYVSNEAAHRGLRTEMAKAMGCQAAYLTQVLAENAELTEDHAFRLVRYLKFSESEGEYFTLLLRISRASGHELKSHLQDQAKKLIEKNSDIQNKVDSKNLNESDEYTQKYFASWIPSTVHIATSSQAYQTPEAIAKRLNLSEQQVLECLLGLESHSLVKKNSQGQWIFSSMPLHLPKRSLLNSNHQMHHRLQAIKALQQGNEADVHFSSVFTLDKESIREIKTILLNAIESSHKKIHAGGTDEIYGICLDLFEIV